MLCSVSDVLYSGFQKFSNSSQSSNFSTFEKGSQILMKWVETTPCFMQLLSGIEMVWCPFLYLIMHLLQTHGP